MDSFHIQDHNAASTPRSTSITLQVLKSLHHQPFLHYDQQIHSLPTSDESDVPDLTPEFISDPKILTKNLKWEMQNLV
jgi:hypothetical protein